METKLSLPRIIMEPQNWIEKNEQFYW